MYSGNLGVVVLRQEVNAPPPQGKAIGISFPVDENPKTRKEDN